MHNLYSTSRKQEYRLRNDFACVLLYILVKPGRYTSKPKMEEKISR